MQSFRKRIENQPKGNLRNKDLKYPPERIKILTREENNWINISKWELYKANLRQIKFIVK